MATKLDSVVEVYAILQLRSPFRQKDALSGHANGWQDKQIVLELFVISTPPCFHTGISLLIERANAQVQATPMVARRISAHATHLLF